MHDVRASVTLNRHGAPRNGRHIEFLGSRTVPIYRPDVWIAVTKDASGDPAVMEIHKCLQTYHSPPNVRTSTNVVGHSDVRNVRTDTGLRAVMDLMKQTAAWLTTHKDPTHKLYGPMYLLHLSVYRRGRLYRNIIPVGKVDPATFRAVVPPAPTDPGYQAYLMGRAQGLSPLRQGALLYKEFQNPPRAAQLHLAFGKEDVTSGSGNYWLERADPLHRPWGHSGAKLFQEWFKLNLDVDFFTWVESNRHSLLIRYGSDDHIVHLLTMDRGVKYVEKSDRWRYRVKVEAATLKRRDPKSIQAREVAPWQDFSTKPLSTVGNGEGWGIFVLSTASKFYSHAHKADKFHHSSFLEGGDVMAAGEWCILRGKLLVIANKTGHYKASDTNIAYALKQLQSAGLNLAQTLYKHTTGSGMEMKWQYYWADRLAAKGSIDELSMIHESQPFKHGLDADEVYAELAECILDDRVWKAMELFGTRGRSGMNRLVTPQPRWKGALKPPLPT